MNKTILTSAVVSLVVLAAFGLGLISVRVGPVSLGTSIGEGFTRHASSTQFSLAAGGLAQQIAATTTCASRIVTTGAAGAGLSFNDQVLNATSIGHWQAASTTVSYDGALYGCGVMRARANGATSLLITEEN